MNANNQVGYDKSESLIDSFDVFYNKEGEKVCKLISKNRSSIDKEISEHKYDKVDAHLWDSHLTE